MNLRRWHAVTVGVLLLILAGFIFATSGPRQEISAPERWLREIIAPVQKAMATASAWAVQTVEGIKDFGALREEIIQLRQRVAELEATVRFLETYAEENERLREIAGVKERLPGRSVTARVIARGHHHWFDYVTIDRGSEDGVVAGMPVINAQGAVGHIENVTAHTARVLLLTDPSSAVGGLIKGRGTPVLVEGTGDPTGRQATVRSMIAGTTIEIGDEVITSDLSSIFPHGVPIGVVSAVQVDPTGLRQHGVIDFYADLQRLDWVIVLIEPTALLSSDVFITDVATGEAE